MATQAEAGRGLSLAEARDWLIIAAAVAVVVGALATGVHWVVSSAVAPLYAEMRGLDSRIEGMDKRLDGINDRMHHIEARLDNHSGILAELRKRLTRIETILLESSEPPREKGS